MFTIFVEYLREKNMVDVGHIEMKFIESSFHRLLLFARIEYSFKLFLSVFNLLNVR